MPAKAAQPAAGANKKAAAPSAAPKKGPAGGAGTGIYVGPLDIRNQTAQEVRSRFSTYGAISQLRLKRTLKARHPYALIWFTDADEAKKAFAEIQKNEEGSRVEYIKAAKPVEARHTYATTLHINPLNVPARSSKGYGKLKQKVLEQFPEAIKTRLHKEQDGTGSALVYFKDNAAAKAAKTRLAGKLFNRPVAVKPSCRTVTKDKKRFVQPLAERKEYQVALEKKIAAEKQAKQEQKLALAKAIKDKEKAVVANNKAFDGLTQKAKADQKASLKNALPDAAVKPKKETKPQIVSKSAAPAKTPPAHTAAKQPIQKTKTQSRKH